MTRRDTPLTRSPQRPTLHALALSLLGLTGALTAHAAPSASALEALRDQARAAYEKGRYEVAVESLTTVVQTLPTSASDYLMLARSAYSQKDYARAAVAYAIYFKLERKPNAEVKAEEREVKKLVQGRQDERRMKMSEERARDVEQLALSKELHGPSGALNALLKIQKEMIFHPRLEPAYKAVHDALVSAQRDLLKAWGRLDRELPASEAQALISGWTEWGKTLAGDEEEAREAADLLRALTALRREPAEALKALQTLKGKDETARYALLLATGAAGRAEEALLFAGALTQRASSEDLTRLNGLLAHYAVRAGRAEEAARALADALYARPPEPPTAPAAQAKAPASAR
jgi:hypothetical protein